MSKYEGALAKHIAYLQDSWQKRYETFPQCQQALDSEKVVNDWKALINTAIGNLGLEIYLGRYYLMDSKEKGTVDIPIYRDVVETVCLEGNLQIVKEEIKSMSQFIHVGCFDENGKVCFEDSGWAHTFTVGLWNNWSPDLKSELNQPLG